MVSTRLTPIRRWSPGWIAAKLRQRVGTASHSWRVRLGAALGTRARGQPVTLLPWPAMAAAPGSCDQSVAGLPARAISADVTDVLNHRFTVLSAGSIHSVSPSAATPDHLAAHVSGVPQEVVQAFRPIDWHSDFATGFRWDPGALYLDVRVAPSAGADIKIPRELSRFQHVGMLAGAPSPVGANEFMLQVLDWIDSNPAARGVNWACTMDVALRAVNWIWGLRLFETSLIGQPAFQRRLASSLHEHGMHIEGNLEYAEELTGNHYLADIAGLVYIGAACPQFPESDRWLLFGLQELVSEMEREVYPDGGAHEASSHYHRLVAELFLSCAVLAERIPVARRQRLAQVDRRAHRVKPALRDPYESGLNLGAGGSLLPAVFHSRVLDMVHFTLALTKPNGLVPQFGDNDSARVHKLHSGGREEFRDHSHLAAVAGEFYDIAELRDAGARASEEARLIAGDMRGRVTLPARSSVHAGPIVHLRDSGIAVWREGPAWLAVTCGPNGQGGRGGHGHNDKNGFELNVHGLDFIVDGGCPVYSADPATRNRFRSNDSHSTVWVDGEQQDRWTPGLAGLFRLVERSAPHLHVEDGLVVGTHRGFGAEHRREFRLRADGLEMFDRLADPRPRSLGFNLDPAVSVEGLSFEADEVRAVFRHSGGVSVALRVKGAVSPEVVPGAFGVGYGQPQANLALRMRLAGETCRTTLSWRA